MDQNTYNLDDASAPDKIPDILRKYAQSFYESATECESAWQDPTAGIPWTMIAKELDRCADRIEVRLKKIDLG